MTNFGERIKHARREKKMSQRKLAELLGVNFTYLSKIENNEMPAPSKEKILGLARHLELDSDNLFALAGRLPDELVDAAVQPHMPTILRAARDLSEEDKKAMLEWIARRKRQPKDGGS